MANGLAEAFNKTLCKTIAKTVDANKKDWHDRMYEALWAYRTTYKTPTGSTPYSLVYGAEAVLPLEIEIPSLRVALLTDLTDDLNVKVSLEELLDADEKRLQAQQKLELYRARMKRAFDKKVHARTFSKGDLVMVMRKDYMAQGHGKKLDPKWKGPYIIEQVYDNGAYLLVDHEGLRPYPPLNGKFLKPFYGG